MKIAVAGIGYVGLSVAVLLAQKNKVVAFDVDNSRVEKINKREPIFRDPEIENFLKTKKLDLSATGDARTAFTDADYIIVAVPTNYDDHANKFETTHVEATIKSAKEINPNALVVIKSTIPIGFTEKIKQTLKHPNVVFSPEFLREGFALADNLRPSRIVIGCDTTTKNRAQDFALEMKRCCLDKNAPILTLSNTDAETVKLFANTFLAMRVAFFNELDTFAESNDLCAADIIRGVCLDKRIGEHFNNPSFGYGGYCFPKDTKQMLANFRGIPQNLIGAIVESNKTRKQFIADQISKRAQKNKIGIYRLTMKSGSDNFRSSAIQGVLQILKDKHHNMVIYEPLLTADSFNDIKIERDLEKFKRDCAVIVCNRRADELNDVADKVYSRDIFGSDK